jgi:hypothetical protein
MDSSILIPDALHFDHHVEVYTARFLVRGNISGAYRRTSDLLNSRDDNFLIVDNPLISSPTQSGGPRQLTSSLMLGRHAIHFVSLAPDAPDEAAENLTTTQNLARETFIAKRAQPCYIFTDTYIIHGTCHLVPDLTLKQYLELDATFISITQPTIYLAAHTSTSWQRELVIANKEKIEGMYLQEPE